MGSFRSWLLVAAGLSVGPARHDAPGESLLNGHRLEDLLDILSEIAIEVERLTSTTGSTVSSPHSSRSPIRYPPESIMPILLILLLAAHHGSPAAIELNGERQRVRWVDGDSFVLESDGSEARIKGYNTLETFGPVHSWGSWTSEALLALALESPQVAASGVWQCTSDRSRDSYGRLLVSCPALALELVRRGYALAYSVDGAAPSALLAAQREAQAARRGIWAGGVPRTILANVHSADESPRPHADNRVVDTDTGRAVLRRHDETYRPCTQVCEGSGSDRSCMLYVPFRHRYHGRPVCLP